MERQLLVDRGKCIGCLACSSVCPAGLIALTDVDRQRTIRFAAACAEDCDLCVPACPTEAIALHPATGAVEPTVVTFDLGVCPRCQETTTPRPVVDRVRAAVMAGIGAPESDLAWLDLCPACRRVLEVEDLAREPLMRRA